MTNEEMVCKANGYCKKMQYEKGDTKYTVAWLAYMAGISQSDAPNYYPVPSVEYLRWRKTADLLVDVHAIFAGWMNDECWTDWDESVRKRVVDMQYELQPFAPAQPQGEGEKDARILLDACKSANEELHATIQSLQSELNALREQVKEKEEKINELTMDNMTDPPPDKSTYLNSL